MKAPAPLGAERRFVANIVAARTSVQITQAHIGTRMRERGFRWGADTLSAVETGRRHLSLRETEALAAIVYVPLTELLEATAERVADTAYRNRHRGRGMV